MRALLLALLAVPSFRALARAQDDDYDDTPALQRYLVDVRLGDSLDRVRWVYPPAQEWPAVVEGRTGVTRYRVDRGYAKAYPAHIETLYLGFKRDRLVEIEVIYDEKRSRTQTVGKVAGEYALVYGEGTRSGDRYWWSDGKTVLRVFPAEIPVPGDGADAVAWRTAVQIFDHGLAGHSAE